MNGVHIITAYHISYHIGYILLHLFIAGVKIFSITIVQKPIRVQTGDMCCRYYSGVNIEHGPVGVHPGVEFHSTFMRFSNHKSQWVIIWNRWPALLPCKPFTPGFVWRRIKCIGGGAYLHNQSIDAIGFVHI